MSCSDTQARYARARPPVGPKTRAERSERTRPTRPIFVRGASDPNTGCAVDTPDIARAAIAHKRAHSRRRHQVPPDASCASTHGAQGMARSPVVRRHPQLFQEPQRPWCLARLAGDNRSRRPGRPQSGPDCRQTACRRQLACRLAKGSKTGHADKYFTMCTAHVRYLICVFENTPYLKFV